MPRYPRAIDKDIEGPDASDLTFDGFDIAHIESQRVRLPKLRTDIAGSTVKFFAASGDKRHFGAGLSECNRTRETDASRGASYDRTPSVQAK